MDTLQDSLLQQVPLQAQLQDTLLELDTPLVADKPLLQRPVVLQQQAVDILRVLPADMLLDNLLVPQLGILLGMLLVDSLLVLLLGILRAPRLPLSKLPLVDSLLALAADKPAAAAGRPVRRPGDMPHGKQLLAAEHSAARPAHAAGRHEGAEVRHGDRGCCGRLISTCGRMTSSHHGRYCHCHHVSCHLCTHSCLFLCPCCLHCDLRANHLGAQTQCPH